MVLSNFSSLILVVLLVVVIIIMPARFVIRLNRRKKRLLKYVSHLPSPKEEWPIIGSGLRFIWKNSEEIMTDSLDFLSSHKTPFFAWIGKYLLIVVDKPEDAFTVLTSKSCMEKAPTYKFFNRVGLLTAPATTLGVNLDSQNGKNSDYLYAWKKGLALVCKRMVNVFYYSDFIYQRSKDFQLEQKYNDAMDALPQKIIAQKKEEYFAQNPTHLPDDTMDANDEDGPSYDTPQIFINKLFQIYSRGGIDDKGICDQVNLMIFAGNDTSALTTAHAMLMLAMHPEIQKRAADEVDQVCADIPLDAPLTYNHITKLGYIDQILLETMRLYPIAPYIFRLCMADTQISKCVIPRSAIVVVSVYSMHRDTNIWGPRPNDFNPDHFHPDNACKRNPNTFAAFSLGPRNCIGMQYAKISMKIMLATMLRHFRFSTHLKMEDIHPKIEITLKFSCGDLVQVERRCKTKN